MEALSHAKSDTLSAAIEAFASPIDGPSAAGVVGALAIVVGLIALVAWAYRRFGPSRVAGTRSPGIRIVGRTEVDRRCAILLVEVDGRRVLVGSTPGQLSALSEWEDGPETEFVVERIEEPAPSRFEGVLARVMTKLRAIEGAPS